MLECLQLLDDHETQQSVKSWQTETSNGFLDSETMETM